MWAIDLAARRRSMGGGAMVVANRFGIIFGQLGSNNYNKAWEEYAPAHCMEFNFRLPET